MILSIIIVNALFGNTICKSISPLIDTDSSNVLDRLRRNNNESTPHVCPPGLVYYPSNKDCYKLFSQGPCEEGKHLKADKSTGIVFCETNICKIDGHVRYHGKCYKLGIADPCRTGSEVLAVDQSTFKVRCFMPSNINFIISVPPNGNKCPKGEKMNSNMNCKYIEHKL